MGRRSRGRSPVRAVPTAMKTGVSQRCTGPAIKRIRFEMALAISGKTDSRTRASMGTDGVASATAAPPSEMPSAASRLARGRLAQPCHGTGDVQGFEPAERDGRPEAFAMRPEVDGQDRDAGPRQEDHPAGQDAAIGPDAVNEQHRAPARDPGHEPSRQGLSRAGNERHRPSADPSGRAGRP